MRSALPLKKQFRINISSVVNLFRQYSYPSGGFRALLYHSVTDKKDENDVKENSVYRGLFHEHMEFLYFHKFNVISCKDALNAVLCRKTLPPKTVCITFDDGYRNILKNAFPALQKFKFPYTIFVTADFIDKDGYINWAEFVSMFKAGLLELGCHGKTHKMLSLLPEKELETEICLPKKILEGMTGEKISLFAYPYGHTASYDRKVIDAVKKAGFSGAFTNILGFNACGRDPYLLYRDRMSWLDDIPEFRKHLNGSYDWCRLFEAFRDKKASGN